MSQDQWDEENGVKRDPMLYMMDLERLCGRNNRMDLFQWVESVFTDYATLQGTVEARFGFVWPKQVVEASQLDDSDITH